MAGKTTFAVSWETGAGGGIHRLGTIIAGAYSLPTPRVSTGRYVLVHAALFGATNIVDMEDFDPIAAAMMSAWLRDSYYRIWVVPAVLQAQNPRIGVPIPFNIWNAFPQSNTVEAVIGTDDEGLSFDFGDGDVWRGIEFRAVNITIGPTAPIQVEASFIFDFIYGQGLFRFEAVIADFVQMRPDPPVTEVWDWLTDVIISDDGSEQRVSLRKSPRRSTSYEIGLENDAGRLRQYNRWFKSLATRLVFPYYQYSARVLQASVIGDSKIYFDPATTDVRADSYIVVLNEETETGALVKIASVDVDGITTSDPLQVNVTAGSIIAPAFSSRIGNLTGYDWFKVHGTLKVEAYALDIREEFSRPGSTAVIETLNGLPILTERPSATHGPSSDRFDVNYEVIDNQTGLLDIKSSWPHPYLLSTRRYALRRAQEPGKMDWWRDFFDQIKGSWGNFYAPSWFNDLPILEEPGTGTNQLRVDHGDYAAQYFPYETYKQVQIELADGRILWFRVLTADGSVPGEATLSLSPAFGPNPEDVAIKVVSFLNLARLETDRVTLLHQHLRTEIEITIRTTDSRDVV